MFQYHATNIPLHDILLSVDDIHNELLTFLTSALHQEAEQYLEKYVEVAFSNGPVFYPLISHLRANEDKIQTSLALLNTPPTPVPRTSLTKRFAHLANLAMTNVAGRGGPTPPPAVHLPALQTGDLPQPTSPVALPAPSPRQSTPKQADSVERIVNMVYDKIRENPGRGIDL